MTATLFAELEEMVPHDLVADIVRGVLDESRQHASRSDGRVHDARGSTLRLERIIRARPARYSKNRPAAERQAVETPAAAIVMAHHLGAWIMSQADSRCIYTDRRRIYKGRGAAAADRGVS